jgi:hypothetical protein
MAGVSGDTVADIETGKVVRPEPDTLIALGEVVGFDLLKHVYGIDGGAPTVGSALSREAGLTPEAFSELVLARLPQIALNTAKEILGDAHAASSSAGVTDMKRRTLERTLDKLGVDDPGERAALSLWALRRGLTPQQFERALQAQLDAIKPRSAAKPSQSSAVKKRPSR